MQNISYRMPGVSKHWIQYPSGAISDVSEPCSNIFIIRSSSGYTGKFPKTRPLPIHAYSFNWQRIKAYNVAQYNYTDGRKEFRDGNILSTVVGGATFNPTFDVTNIYNEAVAKLSDKLRGDLDISVDLAEAGKTAKMLHVTDQLVDFTKTFTRKFGILKTASNAWLQYTYGIRPLLGTIYGVADENLRVVINKTANFSARASAKYKPATVTVNTIWGPVNFPIKSSSLKRSITLGVDMRTDQFDLGRWSSLNPVSIAWELLPYSFVVDWVYNVGGYLRNMETYLLYANKFRSGYKTVLSVGEASFELRDIGSSSTETHTSIHTGSVEQVDIQRTLLSSYPAPRMPSLNAKLGSSRLISAAALLAQQLGRR